jgi:hypothetical protein
MLVQNLAWSFSLLYATAAGLVVTPTHEWVLRDDNGTNTTNACELGTGKTLARSVNLLPNLDAIASDEALEARAPRPKPLARPEDFDGGVVEFLEWIQDTAHGDYDIDITPTPEQLATWKVGRDRTPVGATGLYYRFGKSKRVWKMRGMSGCTASIIASQDGMWASHLWESTRPGNINGGSAFLRRDRDRRGREVVSERSDSEFMRVGVDILSERTPSAERENRAMWRSFADLQSRYGDPFRYSDEVDGFIFTKAESRSNSSPRYSRKISLLQDEYYNQLPDANFRRHVTYIGDRTQYPRRFPAALMGVLGMQYTPCERVENGRCIARFEAWAENGDRPVIVKEWKAISGVQV